MIHILHIYVIAERQKLERPDEDGLEVKPRITTLQGRGGENSGPIVRLFCPRL